MNATRLITIVSAFYGSSPEEMCCRRRPESVWLRAVAAQIAQRYPLISLRDLGRAMGGLDTSSVLYLRDLSQVRGRPVVLDPDLLRLVAIDAEPRGARRRTCNACGGTGVVVEAA